MRPPKRQSNCLRGRPHIFVSAMFVVFAGVNDEGDGGLPACVTDDEHHAPQDLCRAVVFGVRHRFLTAAVRPPPTLRRGPVIPDCPDGEAYQPREAEDDEYDEREGRPDSGAVDVCVN